MPYEGEIRTVGGVTGVYRNGQWGPVPGGTETSDPTLAFMRSLADTAKKTGSGIVSGLASTPSDIVSSVLHPVDTLSNIGSAVAHPVDTVKALSDPTTGGRAIGGLVGGLLTGKLLPKLPAGIGAAGRGAEALGESPTARTVGRIGAGVGAYRAATGDPMGALGGGAVAAVPGLLRAGGRGLQGLSRAMQGLGTDIAGEPAVSGFRAEPITPTAPTQPAQLKGWISSEVPGSSYPRTEPAPASPPPTSAKPATGAATGTTQTGGSVGGAGVSPDVEPGNIQFANLAKMSPADMQELNAFMDRPIDEASLRASQPRSSQDVDLTGNIRMVNPVAPEQRLQQATSSLSRPSPEEAVQTLQGDVPLAGPTRKWIVSPSGVKRGVPQPISSSGPGVPPYEPPMWRQAPLERVPETTLERLPDALRQYTVDLDRQYAQRMGKI